VVFKKSMWTLSGSSTRQAQPGHAHCMNNA